MNEAIEELIKKWEREKSYLDEHDEYERGKYYAMEDFIADLKNLQKQLV